MAKAAQPLSAKDFRTPLLKALATQIKFDSGRTAKADDLYQPVCRMMGINPDDYGDTGGIPWVQKWIQWAFQALRGEGIGFKHGRGTWGLTPDGVDKARSIMVTTAAIPLTSEQEVEALADIISAIGSTNPMTDGTYHPDPYIRSVGLGDHKCMGFYTNQSPVCVGCAAHVMCQRHMMFKMADLAEELHQADLFALKVAAKQVQATGTDVKLASDPAEEPARYRPPVGARVLEQTCSGTVVCDQCGGMINDGDTNVWVRDVGVNKKKSLMLHRECCER